MTARLKAMAFWVIVVSGLGLGLADAALAQGDPANVAKYRANLMKTQTGHLTAIISVVKGEVAYGAHVKQHADAIKAISEMVIDVFPRGSAVGDSRAKPEIWQNWDKFMAGYVNYKTQTAKLAEVAASGDLGAIGAQIQEVGKACGGCHKPFRKEKK